MAKLNDSEFQELCLNFWVLTRANRLDAPRPPPSYHKIMMGGEADRPMQDLPLNKYFPALCITLSSFTEREQIAFYVVYISSPYRNGKKLPMKTVASELGLNRPNVYKMAHETAFKVWRKTKELTELNSKITKPSIDLQVD